MLHAQNQPDAGHLPRPYALLTVISYLYCQSFPSLAAFIAWLLPTKSVAPVSVPAIALPTELWPQVHRSRLKISRPWNGLPREALD